MGILSNDEIIRKLRGLEEREFKKCVADLLEETMVAHDKGSDVRLAGEEYPEADIVCEPPDEDMKTIVHCLQLNEGEKVSKREVEEYLSTHKNHDDVEYVSLITTGELTEDAEWTVFKKSDGLSGVLKKEVYSEIPLAREIQKHGGKHVVDWYAEKEPDGRRLEDASESELDKPLINSDTMLWMILLMLALLWVLYEVLS